MTLLLCGVHPSPVHAQSRLYVQVFDQRTGRVVTDLQTSDVVVREDGVVRTVLDVRPANLLIKLTVLVDNGGAAVRAFSRVQDGLLGFFERLPAHQSMSLLALSPRPRWIVRGTYDWDGIFAGVERIEVESDSSALLLDALVEASEWLAVDPQRYRPVIVIVSADGVDRSTDLATKFGSLIERVRRNDITIHTLLMFTPRPGSLQTRMSMTEALGRDLSRATGGSYASIVLGSGLDQPLAEIAERIRSRNRELASQHVLHFQRPEGDSPGTLQVSVLRFGARITATTTDGRLP